MFFIYDSIKTSIVELQNKGKKLEILSKLTGLFGIIVLLGICFLMSNNKKKINLKTVSVGLLLQFLLAVFILKTPLGAKIFGF